MMNNNNDSDDDNDIMLSVNFKKREYISPRPHSPHKTTLFTFLRGPETHRQALGHQHFPPTKRRASTLGGNSAHSTLARCSYATEKSKARV